MKRFVYTALGFLVLAAATIVGSPLAAEACAGLIGSNGAVNLGRTTTLAAYSNGEEHYVTAFQFLGGGGQFGTLIPLPGVPSKVEKGGAWTLQRLVLETTPRPVVPALARAESAAPAGGVQVLQEVKIDALDLTVLKGGSADVAQWAKDHGFRLSPDAPEVLEFYGKRSSIFLAAIFDGDAANQRGQKVGDGTPVHLTIPTDNPWVPLRILALGRQPNDRVDADVFLLTDGTPTLLPASQSREGFQRSFSGPASKSLLDDLRSDTGMSWVPKSAWLTKVSINAKASSLTYDLAVDASGKGNPSPVAAGLSEPAIEPKRVDEGFNYNALAVIAGLAALGFVGTVAIRRRKAGA